MSASKYETDLVLWAAEQARALRAAALAGSNLPIDWDNIAEEIEALGRSQGRELASLIASILEHLIKLEASPATNPRNGWRETIRRQRTAIELLLADAPSLRQTAPAVVTKLLPKMQKLVLDMLADYGETPRVDVAGLAYTDAQVLGDWFPA